MNSPAPFAVYVHWPFCLSKCPYCDFNSHVRHGGVDETRFVRAIESEIAATAARVPGRTVSTIFFGGGTPSLMRPASVQAILDAIALHWSVASNCEVTLEANPTSVEATRFRGYRSAGVNRVSLGVQALDDAALKELGRLHTAQEALDAVAVARTNFERYSFDLIYARPRQTLQPGRSNSSAPSPKRPSISRSISSPSSRARRSSACTKPASSPFPTTISRAIFGTSRKRPAPRPACRLTKSPITRGRAPNAGTIWSIGAATNMQASARARTVGSISTAAATRPRRKSARRAG